MIVSKTPFRLSFFGGGSDLPSYYMQEEGCVISTSINKYLYITVNEKFDQSIRLSYSLTENVSETKHLQHDIVRNILSSFDIKTGIEITSVSDLPSNGTGMGSSSAFAVGLINALYKYLKITKPNPEALAVMACGIEIDMCGKTIGKQDQFACSYGGFNEFVFKRNSVIVNKIKISDSIKEELEENIILLYTNTSRMANDILKEQSLNTESNISTMNNLKEMVKLAHSFKDNVIKQNISDLGKMLDYSWHLKKNLTDNISNSELDELYNYCMTLGAMGGKILGAGGGGFMLIYADPIVQDKIRQELRRYKPFNIKLGVPGSKALEV
jgi:D-glycero-alpha-D-manno-heptose-7-phosphate kinase